MLSQCGEARVYRPGVRLSAIDTSEPAAARLPRPRPAVQPGPPAAQQALRFPASARSMALVVHPNQTHRMPSISARRETIWAPRRPAPDRARHRTAMPSILPPPIAPRKISAIPILEFSKSRTGRISVPVPRPHRGRDLCAGTSGTLIRCRG